MKNLFSTSLLVVAAILVSSCSVASTSKEQAPLTSIIVVNEGNFMASNSDLTGYNPTTGETANDLFAAANGGSAMGDAPAGATLFGGDLYISLSGSAKAYVIDPETMELKAKITGIDNPRSFAFANSTRGYISHLYEGKVTVFNPSTEEIISTIPLVTNIEDMIIDSDGTILANEWSSGKRLVRIDPTVSVDAVIDSIEVGLQPTSIAMDANGKIWTLCDGGGWDGNPIGFEAPSIVKVEFDGDRMMTIAQKHTLPQVYGPKLVLNPSRDVIYYTLGNKLYSMSINSTELPTTPLIEEAGVGSFYNIAVNPHNGDIYCTDAVDYTQNGSVYRYDRDGKFIESFTAGIIPSLFVF